MTHIKTEGVTMSDSIDHQQQRGAGWDVVDEALELYDEWARDDDYEFYIILTTIVCRMRERRDAYDAQKASAPNT